MYTFSGTPTIWALCVITVQIRYSPRALQAKHLPSVIYTLAEWDFCGIKDWSISNGDRKWDIHERHFLKHTYLHRSCFLFIIYIPSYSLQYSTLISFFKVLIERQAKSLLKLTAAFDKIPSPHTHVPARVFLLSTIVSHFPRWRKDSI